MFEKRNADGDHWISISDMMSCLMMVFLFIAVSYMIEVLKDRERIKEIAVTYTRLQEELYEDLNEEFKDDLEEWQAVIDKPTLSFRFKAPEVLFKTGESEIQPRFGRILADFFPRYVELIGGDRYRSDISEIRIEGHTSSEWNYGTTPHSAYISNMKLSQDRTRAVLEYVLELPLDVFDRTWVRKNLTANGLSSSKLILTSGMENKPASRRVEFRVRTNAERRIVKILEGAES